VAERRREQGFLSSLYIRDKMFFNMQEGLPNHKNLNTYPCEDGKLKATTKRLSFLLSCHCTVFVIEYKKVWSFDRCGH
jgi:hypothetical protein